ncbi:uncharacterized protein LOC128960331 [Oppia nitens]|uniref:uncharacterized protein LOC128960331 n=1 Tax=Oppia nitens TaxID=1686743 RepID=UPI0023DA8D12|nr:uncharacterized protein LOC128960331 [Oppia nitens]
MFGLIVLIELFIVSDGQFFTKTGSKSIPRMGRRADNSLLSLLPEHTSIHKRKLIEAILEKYGDKNSIESDKLAMDSTINENTSLDANKRRLTAFKDHLKSFSFTSEENKESTTRSDFTRLKSLLKSLAYK